MEGYNKDMKGKVGRERNEREQERERAEGERRKTCYKSVLLLQVWLKKTVNIEHPVAEAEISDCSCHSGGGTVFA